MTNKTLVVFRQLSTLELYIKFHKSPFSGSRSVSWGQTDRREEACCRTLLS